MSLLLDALKKAAADKEKSKSDSGDEKPEVAEATPVEDLPNIEDEVFQAPDIDEELITQSGDDSTEEPAVAGNIAEEDLNLELTDDFDLAGDEKAVGEITQPGADEAEIDEADIKPDVTDTLQDISATKENAGHEIEKVQSEKISAHIAIEEPPGNPLPAYNHNDARKILEVSQKRFRNKQRIVYYGMYVFSAVLFFVASYLYYTAETLDNSQRPVFKPNIVATAANKSTLKNSSQMVVDKAEVIKAKPAAEKNRQDAELVSEKVTNSRAATTAVKPQAKITIVKQKKADPLSVLLQRAYQLYQSGQYNEADSLYQQVLQRDKKQRDALLGRAAIAVLKRNYSQAKNTYQQVLYLYPNDSIAKSSLVDLLKKELSVANESQLNVLLRENPQAAHVYFSLGLLYARQERLKESQQAFFDAFSLEKKADYAFNLAVMLDKLSQQKAALVYYKKASELADNDVIHFDEKRVLERIEQLEAGNE